MEKTFTSPQVVMPSGETSSAAAANQAFADLRTLLPPSRRSPLEWALPEHLATPFVLFQDQLRSRLLAAGRRRERGGEELRAFVQAWVAQAPDRPADALFALECLGWCHVLNVVVDCLPATVGQRLWSVLADAVGRPPADSTRPTSFDRQLLHGELPLMLAAVCPSAPQHSVWLALATDCLATGILEAIDPEGLPHAELLDEIRLLLASWTRSLTVVEQSGLPWQADNVRAQFRQLVEQMLRLCRWDGRQVLSPADENDRCVELFQAAVELAGDEAQRMAGLTVERRASRTVAGPSALPLPSEYSEPARLAVLRSDWHADAVQLAVAFPGSRVLCELNGRRGTLWSGQWQAEISVAGQVVQPRGDWEEVCWVSDDAADYLELSQPLDGGWQLHRQLMLVRKGRLVYLADTVSGNRATDITYTGRIPLADRTTLEPADETWEANLVHRRRQGVVVPLFLPEWRSALTNGSLAIEDRHLAWTASQHGVSLFAPVLIVLDRQLLRRPMTWRRLTVAENLAAVPPDVAAGFRVQFGRDQWLIYRSLAGRGNRTLLGQNVVSDFLAARFTSRGTSETLVEIE